MEHHRRIAVMVVFALFALSLIEGPLRKWFLPGAGSPLIFLRDLPAAFLYAYCFIYGLLLRSQLTRVWFIFAAVSSCLGLIPYLFAEQSIFGWALGVRTYWLFMPLAFVVGGTFRHQDIKRLFILIALIAIPYAVLVAYQYNAGQQAWVNFGVGGDDEAAVVLGGQDCPAIWVVHLHGPQCGLYGSIRRSIHCYLPLRNALSIPHVHSRGCRRGLSAQWLS